MSQSPFTLAEYLTPDPNIRAPRPEPQSLPETLPSLSSREISLHSAISVHGWDFFDGRKVYYEAELELTFALLAKMRPDVALVEEQPPPVIFIGDDGRRHRHTFDFLLRMKDGTRGLVAVKPADFVETTGIRRVVDLINEQIGPCTADWTLLFTDQDLSQIDRFNANVVHYARHDPWPQDDAALLKAIRNLKGQSTIGEIAAKSGLAGYGFDAVVRALADRKLEVVEYGYLDDDTVVRLPPAKREG